MVHQPLSHVSMTAKKTIEILRVNYLRGPNIWTYRPVIEAWLDIGRAGGSPLQHPARLLRAPHHVAARPDRAQMQPWRARRFSGTLARRHLGGPHRVEHVSLEIQNRAGMQTSFGKARQTSTAGVYKVAFRTRQEQVGREALVVARDVVLAAINDTAYDLDARTQRCCATWWTTCAWAPAPPTSWMPPPTRGIPHIRLTEGNLVQLGYGIAQRRIWTAETDQTSAIAEEIASDKDLTKSLLQACGVPVPEGSLVNSPEAAWEAAQDIGVPVAVKPYDGNHGRGVSAGTERPGQRGRPPSTWPKSPKWRQRHRGKVHSRQ